LILEVKFSFREVENGCHKVTLNEGVIGSFRLSVTARSDIAEPIFNYLSIYLRIGLDLNHDAHFGVENDGIRDHTEDGFSLFFLFSPSGLS
jgi:hypothetical protein